MPSARQDASPLALELELEPEPVGVASYDLPPSPARSPTGSDNMSVWVEDADGEQRVHVALSSDHNGHNGHSSDVPISLEPDVSTAVAAPPSTSARTPGDVMDFPLVLCESSDATSDCRELATRSSSALVPFQKLQLDTNLNATTLPYASSRSRSNSSSSSPVGSPGGGTEAGGSSAQRKAAQQLASSFLAGETDSSTKMSQEFMKALRLGDLSAQEEPQLSVRLRGSRVELASASEEEHVDFLGPAENIKRLFKLPYSQSRVSLAVHRVGSTLVVDGELEEGDLPAGFEDHPQDTLQLQQQSEEATQSLLYEKFIYESTVRSQLPAPGDDVALEEDQRAKSEPQEQSRLSKSKKHGKKAKKAARKAALASSVDPGSFSPAADGDKRDTTVPKPWIAASGKAKTAATGQASDQHFSSTSDAPPFMPAESDHFASTTHRSPTFNDSTNFQRILNWKFHDLKMILGSQVLLFSNQEHPAVSLKLHDMDKELSLCTVLDYYLDNVIANIPELAICMHSKGLVRGYKLVETRQIPYMSGTGRPLFDIQDVSMNASMLLKFLQENCSRPNGTYWLYRKEGESSLRLYDVNVLSQGKQLKWKYMMAMLCYRFAARASRLVNSLAAGKPHLQQQLQQRQRDLLQTCMSLLGEIAQKGGPAHSSICSSVSEQMADTYLRECNQFHASSPTRASDGDCCDDSEREAVIESLEKAKQYLLASICSFEDCIPQEPNVTLPHSDDGCNDEDVNDGRGQALEEEDTEGEMGSFMDEELNRLQLKFSSTCLELGQLYVGGHKWSNAANCIVEACRFLPLSSIPDDVQPLESWSDQWQAIDDLLETLDFDGVGRSGFSLHKLLMCTSGAELRCCLLGLIGDMASLHPPDVSSVLTVLYEIISGEKRELFESLRGNTSDWANTFNTDTAACEQEKRREAEEEQLMVLSFRAYLRALSPPADSELYFLLMKKLGNASNELGKYFLAAKRDYEEAFRWFKRGCKIFNDIEDAVNVALLQANMAHLHKIFAQGKVADAREEHYRAAIQLCTDALQHLKQSKADLELRRKVKGELALSYLVWAVDLASNTSSQDIAGGGSARSQKTKNREKEVLKTFNKALSLYAELDDAKQVASTHYQIASFYNRTITSLMQSEKGAGSASDAFSSTLKSRMEIARRHYEKALDYFARDIGKTFVLIHQELADMHALGGRVEGIEHALLILLNTYEAFHISSSKESSPEQEDMTALARDVVSRVKQALHQLIRLTSTSLSSGSGGNEHAKTKKLAMFKKMYKEVIYYDGYSAGGSIVPILGTLRAMYLL